MSRVGRNWIDQFLIGDKPIPFALSPSTSLRTGPVEGRGFDKLSPNGFLQSAQNLVVNNRLVQQYAEIVEKFIDAFR